MQQGARRDDGDADHDRQEPVGGDDPGGGKHHAEQHHGQRGDAGTGSGTTVKRMATVRRM